MRGWIGLVCGLLLGVLAWGVGGPADRAVPVDGFQARVALDRSAARVGEPVGVSVEVDLPSGYAAQDPFPPRDEAFASEALEGVEPRPTEHGTLRAWRWTLRPRTPGPQATPGLSLPVTGPQGEALSLELGRLPLEVRSVRAELPERAAVFDIRPPPADSTARGWLLGLAAIGLLGGAVLWWRRRPRAPAPPTPQALARGARAELERIDWDLPREACAAAAQLLAAYASARFSIDPVGRTAAELPECVDVRLRELLARLELLRFRREAAPAEARSCAESIGAYLDDAAG